MSEEDLITAEEHQMSDISFWKDLVRDLRKNFNEFKITSRDVESQLEQMMMEATEESEKATSDLNDQKDEYDKLKRAHEKILYEYKKLKDKYKAEVMDVEQEANKNKDDYEKLKQKYKKMNDRLVTIEMEYEELERRNQAYEGAIENCEEKIDSLLEEIALTQSERDDTKACLSEQVDKLNQQLEEMEIDLEYKEKQIKKYKFLQILHDYPTSASEILDKACQENRAPTRNSLLPSSTRNNSGGEFSLFVKSKAPRKSDAFFMSSKNSFYPSANEDKNFQSETSSDEGRHKKGEIDLFGNEIANDMKKSLKIRKRKNSIDICTNPPKKTSDLYHEDHSDNDKLNKSITHIHQEGQSMKENQRMSEMMEKFDKLNEPAETPEKDEVVNRETVMNCAKPDTPELPSRDQADAGEDLPLQKVPSLILDPKPITSFLTGDSTVKNAREDNEQPTVRKIDDRFERIEKSPDVVNRFMSFGGNKNKPPIGTPKLNKNLTDIEALLEYEGDDMDALAMDNSKDVLRVLENIDEMIDSRINLLYDTDYNIEGYGDNLVSLACV
ncbi:unnamed protein product [Moneuplotes crassus]|uniref:Uncharacterized protein n=1 Tax=Euplotes crassus TaxID=5936 RepID=A0AAD1U8I1_EUPCR|nr:unnamed protein product [Moneuplotes crassus]